MNRFFKKKFNKIGSFLEPFFWFLEYNIYIDFFLFGTNPISQLISLHRKTDEAQLCGLCSPFFPPFPSFSLFFLLFPPFSPSSPSSFVSHSDFSSPFLKSPIFFPAHYVPYLVVYTPGETNILPQLVCIFFFVINLQHTKLGGPKYKIECTPWLEGWRLQTEIVTWFWCMLYCLKKSIKVCLYPF